MIRDVSDVVGLLDRTLGGAGKGAASISRIAAATLVGLLLIGAVLPAPAVNLAKTQYNKKIKDTAVRDVTLDKNDTRGFAHPKHGPNTFVIAWIGASTLQSIAPHRYTFLPADVRQLVPQADGKKVVVDMYFLSGARVVDLYAATQAAIAAKPDLIVVSLNPVWLFNDSAIQGWDNLNSISVVNQVKDPRSWPLLAALASPRDIVLGAADRGIPALRDRWTYAQALRRRVDRLSPLDTSTPPKKAGRPTELQQIAAMGLPLQFWSKYRPATLPNASLAARQLAFLQGGDPSKPTVNDLVVDRMIGNLADSGIPTYVYVDAIDPNALKDPTIDAQLTRIEDHVKTIADRHQASNITVHWRSVGRDVGPMPFDDLVHMKDDRLLAVYLAAQLCDELVSSGTLQACTPSGKKLS